MTAPYKIRWVNCQSLAVAERLEEIHRKTFKDGTHLPIADGKWFGDWWFAKQHGEIAAFLGLVKSTQGLLKGYICRVGVLPEHRGNGLQRRMMCVAERRARKYGWNMIVSDTTENPHSANNFVKAGYQPFMPKEPWSFPEAVYWKKKL